MNLVQLSPNPHSSVKPTIILAAITVISDHLMTYNTPATVGGPHSSTAADCLLDFMP
jgi:hypothetical protein